LLALFKKLAHLVHNKEHLTEQDLSKINRLKLSLNSFREK